jgi:hypothetical protein
MKTEKIQLVKNYRVGPVSKEFLLEKAISQDFIQFMGRLGSLEYFPDFARPFFRITKDECYIIKGVQGNDTFIVLFFHFPEKYEQEIKDHIRDFPDK